MTTVIPVVVAFGLGVLLARRIWRFVPPPQDETVALPGPLPPEEYQRRRQRNNDGYLDSMSKYDKLVPWASGGALVLSATFLSTLVGGARHARLRFTRAGGVLMLWDPRTGSRVKLREQVEAGDVVPVELEAAEAMILTLRP